MIPLDTIIVATGEDSGAETIDPTRSGGVVVTRSHRLQVDPATLQTGRAGVFAAGDVVRGPNTVIDAIADGKKAALVIERFLRGEALNQAGEPDLPRIHIEPLPVDDESPPSGRAEVPRAAAAWRRRNFAEVEVALSVDEATREARRCLRCDLEFTTRRVETPAPEPEEALS